MESHSLERLKQSHSTFPLRYFLVLIANSHARDTIINHFDGAKLLYQWLGPVERLPGYNNDLPTMFHTYEINELATLTHTHSSIISLLILQEFQNGNIRNH